MKTFNTFTDVIQYSKQNPTELTEFKSFDLDENLEEHCFYLNGKLHNEYIWSHGDGLIHTHCFYKNGVRHGECEWFYPDGTLLEHCFYKDGKEHGEYKWFYDDGNLKEHYFYLNGYRHGEHKILYNDGSLEAHCFFLNNKEQPQLQYLTTERDELTLTLLFGDNYINNSTFNYS